MRVKNPSSTSQLNKMTVKELKAELEKLGKSTAGLKADLVARLAEAQRENQTPSTDKTETEETTATSEETDKKEESKEEEKVVVEQPSISKSEEPAPVPEKPKDQPVTEQPKEKQQNVEMETEKEKRKAVDENAEDGKRRKAGATQETAHVVTKAVEEEVREVPPPQHPVTSFLFVRNFVRPFTIPAVEELLNKHGKVVQYAMDSVRSKCYVIYEKPEEAEATRNAVHNLVWPPANKTKLWADFVPEDEATKFIGQNQTQRTSIKTRMVEKEQQPIKTLDDLFRKTETKPHIYYLPLTEEQVAAKKKV